MPDLCVWAAPDTDLDQKKVPPRGLFGNDFFTMGVGEVGVAPGGHPAGSRDTHFNTVWVFCLRLTRRQQTKLLFYDVELFFRQI